jgi:hypothetical protein
MNLHQLFLADLGPDLQLTPETLRQASFAVRRNRNEWLLRQRTRAVIEMIAHTAEQWLEPTHGYRTIALREGLGETGWTPTTLARGLDAFFRSITVESLEAMSGVWTTSRRDQPSTGQDAPRWPSGPN